MHSRIPSTIFISYSAAYIVATFIGLYAFVVSISPYMRTGIDPNQVDFPIGFGYLAILVIGLALVVIGVAFSFKIAVSLNSSTMLAVEFMLLGAVCAYLAISSDNGFLASLQTREIYVGIVSFLASIPYCTLAYQQTRNQKFPVGTSHARFAAVMLSLPFVLVAYSEVILLFVMNNG